MDLVEFNKVESISESYIFPVILSHAFDLNQLVSSLSSSLLQKFNNDSAKSMFALSISKIMIYNLEHQHLSATMRCKLDAELIILRPKIGCMYRGVIELDSSHEVYFVTILDVFVIFLTHEDVLELKKQDVCLGEEMTVVLQHLTVLSKELFGIGKPVDCFPQQHCHNDDDGFIDDEYGDDVCQDMEIDGGSQNAEKNEINENESLIENSNVISDTTTTFLAKAKTTTTTLAKTTISIPRQMKQISAKHDELKNCLQQQQKERKQQEHQHDQSKQKSKQHDEHQQRDQRLKENNKRNHSDDLLAKDEFFE